MIENDSKKEKLIIFKPSLLIDFVKNFFRVSLSPPEHVIKQITVKHISINPDK